MPQVNMANGIREFGRKTPDTVAVVDGERRLTYAALDDRSSRLANALLARGLRGGDRVAIILENRLEYPEIICGLAKAGLIGVPLNPHLTRTEVLSILNHCSAAGLIIDDAFSAISIDIGGATDVRSVLSIGGDQTGYEYERVLAEARGVDPNTRPLETEPFMIMYTSGTTGLPKGVAVSHRARYLTFAFMAFEWGFGPRCRTLAVSPMYFGGGFTSYSTLLFGGTLTMLGPFDPERLVAMIAETKAQNLGVIVPTHAQRLRALSEDVFQAHSTASLESLVFTGAPLPPDVKEWLAQRFPRVRSYEIYGSSEAGVIGTLLPEDFLRKPRSVGQPWFMAEVRLVGDSGENVTTGLPGELFSRSPFQMNGYWNDPGTTEACTTSDGFISSGDIGQFDDEGYLYIVDRKKDMVISGGANVYSFEVEAVLRRHPSVLDVAVIGLPDAEWGERVTAVIVPAAGETIDPVVLRAHCREFLAGFKVPARFEAISELPRSDIGKVLKRELRDRYVQESQDIITP